MLFWKTPLDQHWTAILEVQFNKLGDAATVNTTNCVFQESGQYLIKHTPMVQMFRLTSRTFPEPQSTFSEQKPYSGLIHISKIISWVFSALEFCYKLAFSTLVLGNNCSFASVLPLWKAHHSFVVSIGKGITPHHVVRFEIHKYIKLDISTYFY